MNLIVILITVTVRSVLKLASATEQNGVTQCGAASAENKNKVCIILIFELQHRRVNKT